MWKRGEIAGAISHLFHNTCIFIISLTYGVKLHIHLLNVVVRFIVFLNSANLICRGMDISKCFRESLGLRDNGSRLYIAFLWFWFVCSSSCLGIFALPLVLECLLFLLVPLVSYAALLPCVISRLCYVL